MRTAIPCLALLVAAGCAGGPPAPVSAVAVATAPAGVIDRSAIERRLAAFADDSMEGRASGDPGERRAAAYLAAEAARIGLQPAGESGGYYQTVRFDLRLPTTNRLRIGATSLEPLEDFVVLDLEGEARSVDGVQAVFAGSGDALITPAEAAGKLVILPRTPSTTLQLVQELARGRFAAAAGIALLNAYAPVPLLVEQLRRGSVPESAGAAAPSPLFMLLGARASAALVPATPPARGAALGSVRGDVRQRVVAKQGYNVVAMLPGSDPALRGQYVAFGAHLDHVGRNPAADHDSVRAFNSIVRPLGMDDLTRQPGDGDWPRVRAALDSLRRSRPARADSISNGADDDGSGSIGVLAVAEAFARGPRPRRSLLFVWHTGEELGLVGSRWYTEHPTVPLDSIVAQVNVDMIGRGGAQDLPNGGPGYVQLIGSRRLSTELGDLVERTNAQRNLGFTFDYQFDANGHPLQYYCRSDHYMYARFGIPIVFLSTGGHRDYHMMTDEVEYIDFAKLAAVARLIHDIGESVANLDHRVVVDKPKPDPKASCVQ